MEKIAKVYLVTSRSVLIYNESGEQMHELQKDLNWSTAGERERERKVIERIIQDKPCVYLVRHREWCVPISLREFVFLLGYGPEFADLED